MKGFSKIVALGAVLAASSSLAFADPITGTVGFSGAGTFSGGANGTFTPSPATGENAIVALGADGTGTLAPFTFLTPATFSAFTLTNDTMPSGEQIFTSTASNGTILSFFFGSTDVASQDSTGNGVTLMGTLSETGYTPTRGTVDISANGGSAIFTAGVNAVSATPEPSSLVLLGTGLLGAASAAFRKRGLSS